MSRKHPVWYRFRIMHDFATHSIRSDSNKIFFINLKKDSRVPTCIRRWVAEEKRQMGAMSLPPAIIQGWGRHRQGFQNECMLFILTLIYLLVSHSPIPLAIASSQALLYKSCDISEIRTTIDLSRPCEALFCTIYSWYSFQSTLNTPNIHSADCAELLFETRYVESPSSGKERWSGPYQYLLSDKDHGMEQKSKPDELSVRKIPTNRPSG